MVGLQFIKLLSLSLLVTSSSAWIASSPFKASAIQPCPHESPLYASKSGKDQPLAEKMDTEESVESRRSVLAAMATTFLTGSFVDAAHADEYGKEIEAPTLFTGETVEICTKRGPLGACLKTERRTETNDNDKAKNYFRDPQEQLRTKLYAEEEENSNPLIEKLRQQTEDNKEKNKLYVDRKTFENDQSATFGPFDKQVVIMNTDGKTFTLLAAPQAMRLKSAGFIKDRQFIKQPTEEEIDNALEADGEGLAGALQSLFGT